MKHLARIAVGTAGLILAGLLAAPLVILLQLKLSNPTRDTIINLTITVGKFEIYDWQACLILFVPFLGGLSIGFLAIRFLLRESRED